jgi:16S rRNA C967 or C1407 C5-methylase (RsmB/RsmF family)
MKPLNHINRLLRETHRIQEHGHCKNNPPAWVAVNDIEIDIHELRKAFEENINNERSEKWKRFRKLGRTIRRFLSAGTAG